MAAIDLTKYPYPDEYLNTLHTRQLLILLSRIHKSGHIHWMNDDEEARAQSSDLHRRLRAILATREHIPTKMENKRKRQLAAKRKT
jgi:hypothetical protein